VADERAGERPGSAAADQAAKIDTSVAHPARVYDYWLGGKDNYAADREAAERVLAVTRTQQACTQAPETGHVP
jgi:hypothetical protein